LADVFDIVIGKFEACARIGLAIDHAQDRQGHSVKQRQDYFARRGKPFGLRNVRDLKALLGDKLPGKIGAKRIAGKFRSAGMERRLGVSHS